jgi:glycosyltransferase involved in cell wall biosynthesis
MSNKLTIIIPTRNRASLAINAAESILGQQGLSPHILLSDNSTKDEESSLLNDYVENNRSKNITLIRPQKPLPMSDHWNWAIEHALTNTGGTHFAILTDRMLFRPGLIREVLELIDAHPSKVISYTYDRINDNSQPVAYQPLPRSGLILTLGSSQLLHMAAGMKFSSCLPRMLNSVSPRVLLEKMRARFGSVFSSISPDYCYCFRALSQENSIVYYDKSILLSYAHDRSNGASVSRGTKSLDHVDFLRSQPSGSINSNTPLPQIMTVGNAVVNEYNFVKEESQSPEFLEIKQDAYLEFLAQEVSNYNSQEAMESAFLTLKNAGWIQPSTRMFSSCVKFFNRAALWALSRKFRTTQDAIAYALATGPRTNPIFFALRSDLKNAKI